MDDTNVQKPAKGHLVWPITVSVLPASGMNVVLEPKEAEQQLLADALEVLSVVSFRAELKFTRWRRDGVKVTGNIRARLVQECSLTLEPVQTSLKEGFEALFVPDGSKLAKPPIGPDGEMVLMAEGDDLPDTFVGDKLDAWSITMEHALLAIDPFVRSDDARLEHPSVISAEKAEEQKSASSPFAVLGQLKSAKKD